MIGKKIALLSVVALAVSMLSACGDNTSGNNADNSVGNTVDSEADNDAGNTTDNSEDNTSGNDADYVYIRELNADDYVTLGEYKGIELNETPPVVSDDDVDQYINTYVLSSQATIEPVEDRTDVREGDTVNIDYAGYRDGVAFSGGTAQGYDLTIGSGTFIPGFEDGLIGSNVGDTVSLDLTFPENYSNTDLAGAAVVFEVKINSISVTKLPELTDELVQELDIGDCSTVEELRSYMYDYLYSSAESSYKSTLKNDITKAVMDNCTFKEELPGKLIDRYYDALIEDMSETASYYGMDLTTYIQNAYNMDEETYTGIVRGNAQNMAEQYIMFQAIADMEGLNMTDEEINTASEEWASDYGYESVDALLDQIDKESLGEYFMAEKVVEFLLENAVINTN